jgi:hypothetical protein
MAYLDPNPLTHLNLNPDPIRKLIKIHEYHIVSKKQCCGSVTFWYGSMDPDPDPDPAIFVLDLQGADKKLFFI